MRDLFRYLGYPASVEPDEETRNLAQKALQEVTACAHFRYLYASYREPFDFMLHEGYQHYLAGSTSFLLCATTIGVEVDRQLKRLQVTDMRYAVIFDAAASVYLEHQADAYEQTLPFRPLDFRFCPGYGNTPLTDNRRIADLLKAHTIGISFLDSGLMVPLKSMVGIIRVGIPDRKSCRDCLLLSHCPFRQRNERCYGKEEA